MFIMKYENKLHTIAAAMLCYNFKILSEVKGSLKTH